jgi:hypothetical protein
MTKEVVDLVHGERVELYDLGSRSVSRRQDRTSLVFAVNLHDDPRFVVPVFAPPVCMREEMGATRKEDLDGMAARHNTRLVRSLDQKSWHGAPSRLPMVLSD